MTNRVGPGRPRHATDGAGRSGRSDILDAAAVLFVENGFAATTTRAIAERAGIRQASLYYHFAGKDEILDELLEASVRPTLEVAARLAAEDLTPAQRLYALVRADVETLASTPHNIGTLYVLPEVQLARHEGFRADREALQREYARLGAAVTGDAPGSPQALRLGEMLIQLVEVVIVQRRLRVPDEADAEAIAEACLRVCGVVPRRGDTVGHRAAMPRIGLSPLDDR
ncbi:MAG: TetR/AcrR family transcriptional regulator [Nocardioides sp.]